MAKMVHNIVMATNSTLFIEPEYTAKGKRYHFKDPTYKKFYSVVRYDRLKFRQYLNYKLYGYKCIRRLTQEDILKLCYLKDEYGQCLYYGDEKSIFRYSALHYIDNSPPELDNEQISLFPSLKANKKAGIHEILYNKCDISPKNNKDIIEIHNIVFHPDEKQAEIKNSWQLPLKKRVRLHIRLLWLLKDYNIAESMDWLNEVDVRKL